MRIVGFKNITQWCILLAIVILLTACMSSNEEVEVLTEPENVGIPVPINDNDCKGENYQITSKDGEILRYCLPEDTKSAEEFLSAYNGVGIETNTALLNGSDPTEYYRSAVDVYDDIALNFNQYTAIGKVQDVFIFAEFISTSERENQLKEVMTNSISAFNRTISANEVSHIVNRLMAQGISPQTHIEFDYKNNFYRIEIDDMEAIAVAIRSNEFNGAY